MTNVSSPPRPAFLVVLVGTTDVQLLVKCPDGNHGPVLAELDSNAHWEILERARSKELAARFAIDGKQQSLSKRDNQKPGDRPPLARWKHGALQLDCGWSPVLDAQGRLTLVPAKVDGLVDVLRQDFTVHTVVVCGTLLLRSSEKSAAAGYVVAAFLQPELLQGAAPPSALAVVPGAVRRSAAQWVAVLRDEERPQDHDVVASFNEQGVKRIGQLFHTLAGQATPEDQLILALGGGFPALKPIALEAARLQFGSTRVHPVVERQHTIDLRADLRGRPRMSADLRLATRRQLCALVEKGQFLAAAQAAGEYLLAAEEDRGQPWAVALQAVADLLAARQRQQTVLRRCPTMETLLKRLEVAVEHSSVRTAFNIESALRDDRIIEAVIATYTLQSQLIYDVCRMRYSWVHWDFAEPELQATYNKKFPEYPLEGTRRREIMPGRVKEASHKPWGSILHASDVDARECLLEWIKPAFDEQDWTQYRNRFAHGRIDHGAVETARLEAIAQQIWLDPSRNDGFHLLRHPLLLHVFQHLLKGAGDVDRFYTQLIRELQALLRAPD